MKNSQKEKGPVSNIDEPSQSTSNVSNETVHETEMLL